MTTQIDLLKHPTFFSLFFFFFPGYYRLYSPTPTFLFFIFIDSFVNLWWLQASKAALISFFETWRAELGSDIGITIVTPGLIKSEMSDTANLSKVYFELNETWKLILHQPMILNQVYFAFILEAMKCLKPLDTKRVRRFNSIEQWYGKVPL